MKFWKSESNSVYDNFPYEYKNVFNINKLLKSAFIAKRKYYNKLKTFIKIHTYIYIYIYIYILTFILLKKFTKLFLWFWKYK